MQKKSNIKINLLTVSIFCSFVITLLFYVQSVRIIDRTIDEKIYNSLNYHGMIIENNVENTELLSHQLNNIITTTIPFDSVINDTKAMNSYKSDIAPIIISALQAFDANTGWVVFDTNVLSSAGTISYSKKHDSYVKEPEYDVRTSGYAGLEWWRVAEQKGSAWTTPYYWAPWKATIISYSEQIKINDVLIAMTGSELYFNDISKLLSSAKINETGHLTLLNAQNKVLYDLNQNIIGKDYSKINNGKHNTFINIIDSGKDIDIVKDLPFNKDYIFAYKKLNNGWILLTNLSKKDLDYDINQVNLTTAVIILVLLLLSMINRKFLNKKT